MTNELLALFLGTIAGAATSGAGYWLRGYLDRKKDPELELLAHSLGEARADVAKSARAISALLTTIAERTVRGDIEPGAARTVAREFNAVFPGNSAGEMVKAAADQAESRAKEAKEAGD